MIFIVSCDKLIVSTTLPLPPPPTTLTQSEFKMHLTTHPSWLSEQFNSFLCLANKCNAWSQWDWNIQLLVWYFFPPRNALCLAHKPLTHHFPLIILQELLVENWISVEIMFHFDFPQCKGKFLHICTYEICASYSCLVGKSMLISCLQTLLCYLKMVLVLHFWIAHAEYSYRNVLT